jgi:Ca-activated chloride channel homolog
MVFDNPRALWLLPIIPLVLLVLGVGGWRAKQPVARVLGVPEAGLRRRQIEKYVLAGFVLSLLAGALALPRMVSAAYPIGRSGQVALLVDDTASMAAQVDLASPNRLERTKAILYDIIDQMQGLGGVQVGLFGLTDVARSLVPFVGPANYPYLRTSIDKVLDINATPGSGTSLGRPVIDVTDKFSSNAPAKLIVLFSDGEVFRDNNTGLTSGETFDIEFAGQEARKKGIKVITVGVGEATGARIPLRDTDGKLTGEYAQLEHTDFVSYLDERGLRILAAGSGGKYYSERDSQGLIDTIKANLAPAAGMAQTGQTDGGYPLAPWLIAASLPFWVLLARRHLLV